MRGNYFLGRDYTRACLTSLSRIFTKDLKLIEALLPHKIIERVSLILPSILIVGLYMGM